MSTPGLQTRLLLADVLLLLSQRNSTNGKHSGNIQNQKYIHSSEKPLKVSKIKTLKSAENT